jgi:acyl-CoA thioesterase I
MAGGCATEINVSADPSAELKAQVDKLKTNWPELTRYHSANAALAAPVAGTPRVVFMGDSITDFWPNADGYFAAHGYVGRGISGQTSPQMLVRFRQDVVELKPAVVVILAGTNDVAENTGPYDPSFTEGCLASMVEIAHANGIRVVLSSVLPAYDFPWRPGLNPPAKIAALNDWIREYAKRAHCTYVDYYAAMVDARPGLKADLSPDGVHPNPTGYGVMEGLVDKAIAAALEAPRPSCCAKACCK